MHIQVPIASTYTYTGCITGNHLQLVDYTETGATMVGIQVTTASATASYPILIDNNSFSVVSNGGTDEDISASTDITAALTVGVGNRKLVAAAKAGVANVTMVAA